MRKAKKPRRHLSHFPAKNPQQSARRFIYGVSCLKSGLEKFLELDLKQATPILSKHQEGLDSFSQLIVTVRKNVDKALGLLRLEAIEAKDLTDPPKKRESKQATKNIVQTLLGGITAFQNGTKVLFEEPRKNILHLLKNQKTPPGTLKGRLLSIREMLQQLDIEFK